MKVTRDKTLSVDLGNGLRLTYDSLNGCWLHYTDSNADTASEKLDLENNWANEILAKHFTPITITLETEDEACTLWNLLNVNATDINKNEMFLSLHSVYRPEDAQ